MIGFIEISFRMINLIDYEKSWFSESVSIIPDNTLIVTFDGINLPPEESDPVGSNGYISFAISLKDNVPEGTKIYNQAEIYSSEIAKRLKIAHSTKILKKRHDGNSQTKRNKLQRLRHLTKMYYTTQKVEGKHILLVDDVITSGATIETCAQLLIEAGASKISVLAFMLVK